MLKQTLVQEKLSDLINGAALVAVNDKQKSTDIHLEKGKTNADLLPSQYNMPQWPRVQLDKQITSNLKRNSKIVIHNSSGYESSIQQATNSRFRR